MFTKVRLQSLFVSAVLVLSLLVVVLPLSTANAKPHHYSAWVAVDEGANLVLRARPSPQAFNLRALPSGTILTIKAGTITALNVTLPPLPTPYGYVLPAPSANVVVDTTCSIDGWAVDGAAPAEAAHIRVTVGSRTGPALFDQYTSLARPDVTNATGATGPSGFSITFGGESGLLDGQGHAIFVTAMGHNGNTLLNGAPQTLTCKNNPNVASAPPLLDQYWLQVEDDSKSGEGVAIGWVNARYVFVFDADKTPAPASIQDAQVRGLDVMDLVKRGYIKTVTQETVEVGKVFPAGTPGAPTHSAASKVTLSTARIVVVGGVLNPGVGLNLREAPSAASRSLTDKPLPQGTRLTVLARPTDDKGNWAQIDDRYWLMVGYAPDNGPSIVGYVDSAFVTPVDDAEGATAVPIVATATPGSISMPTAVLPTVPAAPTVIVPTP